MDAKKAEAIRAKRREYKRQGRICASPGFKPAHHDAHGKMWGRYLTTLALHDSHVRLFFCQGSALHDAHVLCWNKRERTRIKDGQASTRAARIKRRSAERMRLADNYIVTLLTGGRKAKAESAGVPVELIELKRAHLRLVRFLNERKETKA